MKTIKQPRYALIRPEKGFRPLGPVSHLEIQPVKEHDGYCEPCAEGDEDFWSVYVCYDPSGTGAGVDCIADCADFEGASTLARLIAALLGVEAIGL